jgi:hypothetical protein
MYSNFFLWKSFTREWKTWTTVQDVRRRLRTYKHTHHTLYLFTVMDPSRDPYTHILCLPSTFSCQTTFISGSPEVMNCVCPFLITLTVPPLVIQYECYSMVIHIYTLSVLWTWRRISKDWGNWVLSHTLFRLCESEQPHGPWLDWNLITKWLLSDKERDKQKTYIWVSVWWKTKDWSWNGEMIHWCHTEPRCQVRRLLV